MTRFARAEGSKASNKKNPEESTAWSDLKPQKRTVSAQNVEKIPSNEAPMIKPKRKASKNSMVEQDLSSDVGPPQDTSPIAEIERLDNPTQAKTSFKSKKRKVLSDGEERTAKKKIFKDLISADDDTCEFDLEVDSASKHSDTSATSHAKKPKEKKQKECVNYITEDDGSRYKVFKDGLKKPWYDLPYEENEMMTKYNKFFVFRTDVERLNELKAALEEEGLDNDMMTKRMFTHERKSHNRLRVFLLRKQIKQSRTSKTDQEEGNHYPRKKNNPVFDLKFEENDFMTNYDGFWVRKESVKDLETIRRVKVKRLMKARVDGDSNPELTEQESQTLRRQMKMEKRRETRILKMELIRQHKNEYEENERRKSNPGRPRRPGKYLGIDYKREDLAKFEGFFVDKEAAERLQTLKDKLTAEGLPEEEVNAIVKKQRRKEERIMKKDKRQTCYNCRESGHVSALCPESKQSWKSGAEVCYRCGSTEHMARSCTISTKGSSFAHAVCFYCSKSGHIARECPDNPKGLYPEGGSCRKCGSVEHLKRDCPKIQKWKEDSSITLHMRNPTDSIDAESFDFASSPQKAQTRVSKPKHISFD